MRKKEIKDTSLNARWRQAAFFALGMGTRKRRLNAIKAAALLENEQAQKAKDGERDIQRAAS